MHDLTDHVLQNEIATLARLMVVVFVTRGGRLSQEEIDGALGLDYGRDEQTRG